MSDFVQGVRLRFKLPFELPKPATFPFDLIGDYTPVNRIPKYEFELEKEIMSDITKQQQEEQIQQLKQAQQQLSMVDIIASRKNRHKGKEPETNSEGRPNASATASTTETPSSNPELVKPKSDSGTARLQGKFGISENQQSPTPEVLSVSQSQQGRFPPQTQTPNAINSGFQSETQNISRPQSVPTNSSQAPASPEIAESVPIKPITTIPTAIMPTPTHISSASSTLAPNINSNLAGAHMTSPSGQAAYPQIGKAQQGQYTVYQPAQLVQPSNMPPSSLQTGSHYTPITAASSSQPILPPQPPQSQPPMQNRIPPSAHPKNSYAQYSTSLSSLPQRADQPPVQNSSAAPSYPALPPKPDEWKPRPNVAPGAPIRDDRPPVPPRVRQDPAAPAIPPKPFSTFSEFDFADDGPSMSGSSEGNGHVEQVSTLMNMGFSKPQAVQALEMYDYDVNKASNYLIDNSM